MRARRPLQIDTYELGAEDRHRLRAATEVCHGVTPPSRPTPARDAVTPVVMPFSLAVADGGALLVLSRRGHLPQAIRVNELVVSWLAALDERAMVPTRPRQGEGDDDA
jgi:hypothetical protein